VLDRGEGAARRIPEFPVASGRRDPARLDETLMLSVASTLRRRAQRERRDYPRQNARTDRLGPGIRDDDLTQASIVVQRTTREDRLTIDMCLLTNTSPRSIDSFVDPDGPTGKPV
jgi:hypothetical protein